MTLTALPTTLAAGSVGELYRGFSRRLESIVRADVHAPDPVIEDACQHAWGGLLAGMTRIRAEAALSWLATSATREAWRLMHVRDRDAPLDGADPAADGAVEPVAPGSVVAVAEERDQLRLIRKLPERQQRILWLRALGLSYEEIAAYTGDTPRTVQRQLLRGRQRVRQLAG